MAIEIGGIIHNGKLKTEWTKWKKTFCFLPHKDITGIFIMGPIWYRIQESCIYEYPDDVGYYVSANLGYVEYARTKKDIFCRSLTGKEEHRIQI